MVLTYSHITGEDDLKPEIHLEALPPSTQTRIEKLTTVHSLLCSPLELFPASFPWDFILGIFPQRAVKHLAAHLLGAAFCVGPIWATSFISASPDPSSYIISSNSSAFSSVSPRCPRLLFLLFTAKASSCSYVVTRCCGCAHLSLLGPPAYLPN